MHWESMLMGSIDDDGNDGAGDPIADGRPDNLVLSAQQFVDTKIIGGGV
jgi:hypothetical protein